ncbi:hypothetical protein CBR_g55420 [Chara braunii]|uniref:Uncharacterized protein n=1 Tax=Chara braunii TaxID=69332 RepID=A0A388K7R7_CHABU|nr:hypothetical protein CBR_g55420 [Chara braunii]|eukprot:GBG66077.1 hypothetical protein CBR_g55420 [Chara braunii]
MVYRICPTLKHQVGTYVMLELMENIMGYIALTMLMLVLGSFGPSMDSKTMFDCFILAFLTAFYKGFSFIRSKCIDGLSCSQIATIQNEQGSAGGGSLAGRSSYALIPLNTRRIFAHVGTWTWPLPRQLALALQLYIGWDLYRSVRDPDDDNGGNPAAGNLKDLGTICEGDKTTAQRLRDFVVITCVCVLLYSILTASVVYLSFLCSLHRQFTTPGRNCGKCNGNGWWCLLPCRHHSDSDEPGSQSRSRRKSRPAREGSSGGGGGKNENDALGKPFLDGRGSLWERLERLQREIDLAVVWHVHCQRHSAYTSADAQSDQGGCGLKCHWFHDVEELLQIVRGNLIGMSAGRVAEETRLALEALEELAKGKKVQGVELLVSEQMNLPQASRCTRDLDACRDFAQSQGYLVMLQVLECCPRNSQEVRLAASILAGFTAGLSLLPWQPDEKEWEEGEGEVKGEGEGEGEGEEEEEGKEAGRGVLKTLEDDDFEYCTKQILDVLVDIVSTPASVSASLLGNRVINGNGNNKNSPAATSATTITTLGSPRTTESPEVLRSTSRRLSAVEPDGGGESDVDDDLSALREAAMSAICAFALAASDIHAHVRCPEWSRRAPRNEGEVAAPGGQLQEQSAGQVCGKPRDMCANHNDKGCARNPGGSLADSIGISGSGSSRGQSNPSTGLNDPQASAGRGTFSSPSHNGGQIPTEVHGTIGTTLIPLIPTGMPTGERDLVVSTGHDDAMDTQAQSEDREPHGQSQDSEDSSLCSVNVFQEQSDHGSNPAARKRSVASSPIRQHRNSSTRLANAYTTLCPTGWLLRTGDPNLERAHEVWVATVTSVLGSSAAVKTLLMYATNQFKLPSNSTLISDSVRTLSSLFSSRMIYWHRFDKKLTETADFPPPLCCLDSSKVHEITELKSLVARCLTDKNDPPSTPSLSPSLPSSLSVLSKLHLAKILLSQNIRDIDKEIAEMLLQCLCFCRQAVGAREFRWFAFEVIEALRDLFCSSNDKSVLEGVICTSPGGVDCLRLLLVFNVTHIRAVRFPIKGKDLTGEAFDRKFAESLSVEGRKNSWWIQDSQEKAASAKPQYNHRSVIAAAGLLAELFEYSLGESGAILSPGVRKKDFFLTLFKSISPILETCMKELTAENDGESQSEKWTQSDGKTAACCMDFVFKQVGSVKEGIFLLFRNLEARVHWLFWDSMGKPVWRPAFRFSENINPFITGDGGNKIAQDQFEIRVNAILGRRNTVRIIHSLLQSGEYQHQVLMDPEHLDILFPSLVKLITIPPPSHKLLSQLELENWEADCNSKVEEWAAEILVDMIQREHLHETQMSTHTPTHTQAKKKQTESQKEMRMQALDAMSELKLWARKMDLKGGRSQRGGRDLERGEHTAKLIDELQKIMRASHTLHHPQKTEIRGAFCGPLSYSLLGS